MRVTRRSVLRSGAAVMASAALGGGAALAKSRSLAKDDEFLKYDAMGLAALVRRREVSPSELLDHAAARMVEQDARFNFIAHEMVDYGRAQIAKGLPKGPFTGVPFLVKDLNTHIVGHPTGQGSRLYKGYTPNVTSELVRRQEAAGLVIFGKTTTPEFGLTGTTESLAEGATLNPWNPAHSSGGSSGGASSAVAAGVVPMAHASDGGGSIRIPASACGLFGLKPSRGRVPMGPLRTEGWGGLSTNGVISRSVRDTAAMLDATHGVELGSRYGAPTPDGSFLSQVTKKPGRLRIALMLKPLSGAPVDAEVLAATRAAAKLCEDLGHIVEEAAPQIDPAPMGEASFAIISTALGVDIDARAKALGVAVDGAVLEPITLTFYHAGKQIPGSMVANAHNVLQDVSIKVAQFMANYDIILSPVLASPSAPIGVHDLTKTDFAKWGAAAAAYIPFPGLFNMTGQPSMSVPLAMAQSGLPIGIMFTGRYGDEATLLRLAGQLERAAPWFDRMPKL